MRTLDGKRQYTDNLAHLGTEKREEVLAAVDEWLDAVRVTTAAAPERVRLKCVKFTLVVDGEEVDVEQTVKGFPNG